MLPIMTQLAIFLRCHFLYSFCRGVQWRLKKVYRAYITQFYYACRWRYYGQRTLLILCPNQCFVCRLYTSEVTGLCPSCQQQLRLTEMAKRCWYCAKSLRHGNEICASCLNRRPPLDHTIVAYNYVPPIDQFICLLKFSGRLVYATVLAQLLLQKLIANQTPPPDYILPMPLHAKRLSERGFNQAVEIARPLARHFCRPLIKHGIQRLRHNLPQAGLSSSQRQKNMQGVFRAQMSFAHQDVVIVDDVVTTTATVSALAHVLRRAGAKRVYVWAIARSD